ncbi:MAG: CBS domain-containing protein [Betaproteobacteria bacterium]|nr:CBS domain-containing protein [Betaproteobacteria bacterium]
MSIGKFCRRNVVCAVPDTTIVDAAQLMRRNHIGDLIVVDTLGAERRPVGIVTDRDIVVEVVSVGLDPGLVKLGDLLTQPLVTVDEDTGYAETIRLMSARGVRRMPVVNKAGILVGIVSFDDLFHQLGIPLSELSGLAIREVRHEAETRK